MARYVLRLLGTNEYLKRVAGNTNFVEVTNKTNEAIVYSDSMLERDRMEIVSKIRKEFNSKIEVVRVL